MGQYMIKFPDDLHKSAKLEALKEDITLKKLIIKAVTEYLEKKGV